VVELILEHMDQDCVLECLPGTLETVLHYACIRRNFKVKTDTLKQKNKSILNVKLISVYFTLYFYQVAELLVRHLMAEEETPSVSSRLVKLLETRTTSGLTALLIAVSKKDCPLIDSPTLVKVIIFLLKF